MARKLRLSHMHRARPRFEGLAEVLDQHQVAAMLLVLSEQQRSFVGGHGKAVGGVTSERGNLRLFARGKVQKLDGRGCLFRNEVHSELLMAKLFVQILSTT